MKNICIITDNISNTMTSYSTLGCEAIVVYNLVKELIRQNYNLTIFTQPETYIDIDGCNVVELKYPYKHKDFIDDLENELSKYSFDEIFSVRAPIPYNTYFLQCHSIMHRVKNSTFPMNLLNLFLRKKQLIRQKNKFSNTGRSLKYIAVSKIIKEDYKNNFGINDEDIKVAYIACNQQYEKLPEIEKKECPTFGIVANSSINKRGHYFILAMGILKLLGFNFKIKMIAPKYNKDIFLKGLINIFGLKKNTEILPKQNDMSSFYKSIDYLALPSWNEAFGLVVIEAMSYGKPCIVSSSAGSAEILSENDGFVFKRNSLLNFLMQLKTMINLYQSDFEKYKCFANNAFETSKIYSWENFVKNILE